MTSNRFDFLELNEQGAPAIPDIAVTSDEGVIRFDAPTSSAAAPNYVEEQKSGGLEQEVYYKRGVLRVMEVIGSRGTVAGAFSYPAGIAVDRNGIMFIADACNHRLQRITSDGGVAIVGGRGSGRGQFIGPVGIAVDEDRSFYVVEQGNNRVQKFTADGVFQFSIGREGTRPGEFRSPTGIAVVRGTKLIYVADAGNARIQCFNSAGVFLGIIGAPGGVNPRIANPQAVACDYNGNIFIADSVSHRIIQFDPGGRFIAFYGGPPHPNNRAPNLELSEPHALGFDERGRLYIADGLMTQGRLTAVVPETGAILTVLENVGRGLGHLARPGGIAACPVVQSRIEPGTERGDVYVSDTLNHRILRFVWS